MAGAKKPTSKSKPKSKSKRSDADRLASLHEVGLFRELHDVPPTKRGNALAHAIDRLDDREPYRYRALQQIPTGLGLERVLVASGRRHVMLTTGAHAGLYQPRTHHAWAALVDLGLAAIGDDRRLVPIAGADFEEPLFVLATPAQAKALYAADVDDDLAEQSLPRPISIAQRLRELATSLARRLPDGTAIHATAEAIELDLDPAQVAALVERLHEAHHADLALGVYMKAEGLL